MCQYYIKKLFHYDVVESIQQGQNIGIFALNTLHKSKCNDSIFISNTIEFAIHTSFKEMFPLLKVTFLTVSNTVILFIYLFMFTYSNSKERKEKFLFIPEN